jgi:uncharacterized membrane protein
MEEDKKENIFFRIISLMGAILIFVGIAWIIAKNWHQIPDLLKVFILVFSTFVAFASGIFFRLYNYEGTGRGLIALGAGLYLLSLFLISQIYHLATTTQHYAWLLFFGWTIILAIAYLLESPENLVFSLILFFCWIGLQYISSVTNLVILNALGIVFLYLSAGVLLYSLSIWHNSVKHAYTNIYRFWAVFYFLFIFYILSFQSILPILANYSFEGGIFTIFLLSFILISFFSFVISILFASSKGNIKIKEILIFIGLIFLLFIFVFASKPAAGMIGSCYLENCYNFETSSQCNSAPGQLNCIWNDEFDSCNRFNCWGLDKIECDLSKCKFENNRCMHEQENNNLYEICEDNDVRDACLSNEMCSWRAGYWSIGKKLPFSTWVLWSIINVFFILFIVLILGYGQLVSSIPIINLGMGFFILNILTRYIGFWMDFKGYFAFSILAILGGILLIFGSWLIPKWRKNLLNRTNQIKQNEKKIN